MTRMPGFVAAMLVAASVAANAQTAERLSLQDAEMRALQYNPAIKVGEYDALAANQVVREARSALFPTVFKAHGEGYVREWKVLACASQC